MIHIKRLSQVRTRVGEARAREAAFEAFGRGLVERIAWQPDARGDEFYEGKSTRAGHIALGLDVERGLWMEQIKLKAEAAGVVIVRSSSGQGKSTLALRYAHESWPAEHTFVLKAAQTLEQVEAIRLFLRGRVRDLELPTFLLIDNAGSSTRHWPLIVQECAALGIQVLATMRQEDWYRYSQESLFVYELVEPILELDEARRIFAGFQERGRLHQSITSADAAYARIGEPHLLLEFVYLITQGQMLEDRLRDQVRGFVGEQEDPAKREILRRVADVLGAPVSRRELLRAVPLRDDPQQVLGSLANEYLTIEDGHLSGLHWVRSEHLMRLLHEGYCDPAETALKVLPVVPEDTLAPFVANALCLGALDDGEFMQGLIKAAHAEAARGDVKSLLRYLEGIFEAGEREFLEANRAPFDAAYEQLGGAGPFILQGEFLPGVKVEWLSKFSSEGGAFGDLQRLAAQVEASPRGREKCRAFLGAIAPSLDARLLAQSSAVSLAEIGALLSWHAFCGVAIPSWASIKQPLLERAAPLDFSLEELCALADGLWRFDADAYREWFSRQEADVLGFLRLATDSPRLELERGTPEGDIASVQFFFDQEDAEKGLSANQEAVSRLDRLGSALPFCAFYRSRSLPLTPQEAAQPPKDGTHKNLERGKYLHSQFDLARNRVWVNVVDVRYGLDNAYEFQKAWYAVRQNALQIAEAFAVGLPLVMAGRSFDFDAALKGEGATNDACSSLSVALDRLPQQAPVALQSLQEELKAASDLATFWRAFLSNFGKVNLLHPTPQLNAEEMATRELVIFNVRDVLKCLPAVQAAFKRLREVSPDYFEARDLDAREAKAYAEMELLLGARLLDPPPPSTRSVLRYLQDARERRQREVRAEVQSALSALASQGISFGYPTGAYRLHPLDFVPLGFSIFDPCRAQEEHKAVAQALQAASDVADFFCLMPLFEGARFGHSGFLVKSDRLKYLPETSSNTIRILEASMTREVPTEAWDFLPPLPLREYAPAQVREQVARVLRLWRRLALRSAAIAPLAESPNAFDKQLFDRHREEAHRGLRDLLPSVREARTFVLALNRAEERAAAHSQVVAFLDEVERRISDEQWANLLSVDAFDVTRILDALDSLVERQV